MQISKSPALVDGKFNISSNNGKLELGIFLLAEFEDFFSERSKIPEIADMVKLPLEIVGYAENILTLGLLYTNPDQNPQGP